MATWCSPEDLLWKPVGSSAGVWLAHFNQQQMNAQGPQGALDPRQGLIRLKLILLRGKIGQQLCQKYFQGRKESFYHFKEWVIIRKLNSFPLTAMTLWTHNLASCNYPNRRKAKAVVSGYPCSQRRSLPCQANISVKGPWSRFKVIGEWYFKY